MCLCVCVLLCMSLGGEQGMLMMGVGIWDLTNLSTEKSTKLQNSWGESYKILFVSITSLSVALIGQTSACLHAHDNGNMLMFRW